MQGAKGVVFWVLTATIAVWAAETAEQEQESEKPAMDIGGYVTVDYLRETVNPNGVAFGIGEVDLGANVYISPEVVASVVIMSENDLHDLWIDQALVSYKPANTSYEFLFGQQTFNHGLLSTRIISDPLIMNKDRMEIAAPGAIVNKGFGELFTGGAGFTIFSSDSLDLVSMETIQIREYSGIINIDCALPNESMLRLSSLVHENYFDIDLAGTAAWKNLIFDAESVFTLRAPDSKKESGFYAGAIWQANDRLGLALRGDALSPDDFETTDKRVAGGISVAVKDGIFAALEFAHEMPHGADAYQTLAIQIGLEQKMSLPGFQRKTLTRE